MNTSFKVVTKLQHKENGSIKVHTSYWVLTKEELENESLPLFLKNVYEHSYEIISYTYELIDCFVTTDYIKQEYEIIKKHDKDKEIEDQIILLEFEFNQELSEKTLMFSDNANRLILLYNSATKRSEKTFFRTASVILNQEISNELTSLLNKITRATAIILSLKQKYSRVQDDIESYLIPPGEDLIKFCKLDVELCNLNNNYVYLDRIKCKLNNCFNNK